ncbi:NAD(P)/FAD-dependent oxidoreductase [Natrialbaceae archaeon A-CW2]
MHVVVLGGGYAGVTLMRALERDLPVDVELTLVNDSPTHLVQHELHRVIRRPAVAGEISIPLTDLLERATVHVGVVESIDTERRTVHLEDETHLEDGTLTYDFCAVCLGAETAFYGLESVREHALPLKRVGDATAIRSGVQRALESESETTDIVVGGAGLSGIQVAGELAALLEESAPERVDDGTASVTLLEQAATVAPEFDRSFQEATRDVLERVGVDVRTESTVTDAGESTVTVRSADENSPRTLRADVFVWTGGISGQDALEGERPQVNRTLRLDDRTFVVGDAARVIDAEGEAVPASAQSAVREAIVVAESIRRLIEYEHQGGVFEPRLESFTFESPGWLVSVGDDAVAQVGPSVFTGAPAKALKTTVGVGYLSSIGSVREAVDLVQNELCASSHSRQSQ